MPTVSKSLANGPKAGTVAGHALHRIPFCYNGIGQWGSRDLNPGPTDYESAALTS